MDVYKTHFNHSHQYSLNIQIRKAQIKIFFGEYAKDKLISPQRACIYSGLFDNIFNIPSLKGLEANICINNHLCAIKLRFLFCFENKEQDTISRPIVFFPSICKRKIILYKKKENKIHFFSWGSLLIQFQWVKGYITSAGSHSL